MTENAPNSRSLSERAVRTEVAKLVPEISTWSHSAKLLPNPRMAKFHKRPPRAGGGEDNEGSITVAAVDISISRKGRTIRPQKTSTAQAWEVRTARIFSAILEFSTTQDDPTGQ